MQTYTRNSALTLHKPLADSVVLDCESKATFNELLECHMETLKPADAVEAGIVENMASDFWRMSRRFHIDVTLLNSAADARPVATPSAAERSLLADYEVRLRRKYKSSLWMIKLIRSFNSRDRKPVKDRTGRPEKPKLLPEPNSAKNQTNLELAVSPEVPARAKRT